MITKLDEAKNLAFFVAEAIKVNNIIDDNNINFAVEIAEEEIIARQAAGDYYLNHDNPISGDSLAALIIDAMFDGKIIEENRFDEAIKVATKIIDQHRIITPE